MENVQDIITKKLRTDFPLLSGNDDIHYHVLAPKSTVYYFKDQKRRDKIYDFRAEIVCKFYHRKNILLETAGIDKFILSVPFYTLWTFPVSFYAMAKFMCLGDNGAELSDTEKMLLETFVGKPILGYIKKGSDLTNQQPIQLVRYLARTLEEHNFFKSLNHCFQSAVDVMMTKSPLEDFLLQYNHVSERTIYNVLDFSGLFSYSSKFEYEYSQQNINAPMQSQGHMTVYSQGNTTSGRWEPFRTKIVRIKISRIGEDVNTDPQKVFATINNLWKGLIGNETFPTSLADFPFRLTAFDIEAGYSREFAQDEACMAVKTFPNIFNSFCQCICARSWIYRKGLEGSVVNYHFVLCPSYIATPREVSRKWNERISSHMFWFKESIFVVFESEVDLIRQFLHMVLTKSDILIGYNSPKFDIPYLIMRYNFLVNPQNVLVSPLQYYPLVDFGYRVGLNIRMKSIEIYCDNMIEQDQKCSTLNNIKDMRVVNGVVDCVKCHRPINVSIKGFIRFGLYYYISFFLRST